jgi:hypothetical protein
MGRSALALVFAAAIAAPALAHESAVELATGGLIFVRNENLEMLSQELSISPSEISIRYRVLNKSDRDITVLAAFPMPDLHIEGPDDSPSLPTDDPINLLAFAAAANGKAIAANVEQRVISAGLDRTRLLRDLGIPLAPHLASIRGALDRLSPDKAEELGRLGLVESEVYDEGSGMRRHLGARWTLQTTFSWEQRFTANSETVIEQHYRPSIGRSPQTLLGSPAEEKEPWYDEYKDKYCFGYEFLAAVEAARKAAGSKLGAPFSEQRIEYQHKTWVNGLGSPIKQFRLVVDKAAPENLVSFCGEEPKKLDETKLEVTKSDYTPDGTLAILFLTRLRQQ